MNGALSRGVDSASSSAHGAIDRASDAARPAVEQLAAEAHNTVDNLAAAAGRAAGRIEGESRHLRDAGCRMADRCGDHIRNKPIAALGIAAAAGFLISWLLRLR